MNKKIKLSILSTLAITTITSVALPIVSCSNTNSNETNLKIQSVSSGKEKLKTEISKLFPSTDLIGEQEELYKSLKGKNTFNNNPVIYNALKETLSFSDGLTWDDVVSEYIVFIDQGNALSGGKPIPGFAFEIIIKKDYSYDETSKNLLTFKIENFANASVANKRLTVKENSAKKTEAINNIKTNLASKTTALGQSDYIKSLENIAESNALYSLLLNSATFINDDGSQVTDNKTIITSIEVKVNGNVEFGKKIPDISVKLIPKLEYAIDSSLLKFLNFELTGFGNASAVFDNLNIAYNNAFETAVKSLFYQDQPLLEAMKIYKGLSTLNADLLTKLKQSFVFTSQTNTGTTYNWDEVIESYTVTPTPNAAINIGGAIPDVAFSITLKPGFSGQLTSSGYTLTNKFEFNIQNIGTCNAAPIQLIIGKDIDIQNKMIEGFINDLRYQDGFRYEKTYFEKLPKDFFKESSVSGVNFFQLYKSMFTITFENLEGASVSVPWDTAVKSVVVSLEQIEMTAGGKMPNINISMILNTNFANPLNIVLDLNKNFSST